MTFEYTGPDSEGAIGPKDEVRFLLGDTVDEGHHLEDEEIYYAVAKWYPLHGTYHYVAAVLAESIAARYAREAQINADGVSVSLGPVGDQFKALAAVLREQHKSLLVGGSPDVGGISPYEERSPMVKNFAFGTGMHDDLAAGNQDYGDQGPPYYPIEHYPGASGG